MAQVLKPVGVELQHVQFRFVIDHLYAHCANLLFEERVELLDDEKLLNRLCEVGDKRLGERIRPAKLEDGELRENLLNVLIGDCARDDSEIGAPLLDAVHVRRDGSRLHRRRALLRGETVSAREHRHGDMLGDVALVGNQRMRRGIEVPQLHE